MIFQVKASTPQPTSKSHPVLDTVSCYKLCFPSSGVVRAWKFISVRNVLRGKGAFDFIWVVERLEMLFIIIVD